MHVYVTAYMLTAPICTGASIYIWGVHTSHIHTGTKSFKYICILAQCLSNMHMGSVNMHIVYCVMPMGIACCAQRNASFHMHMGGPVCIWDLPYAYGELQCPKYWRSSVGNNIQL